MTTPFSNIIPTLDESRQARGFRTVSEVLSLRDTGNEIYDPFSVLISTAVVVGSGNTFFPSVHIECSESGELVIGDNNTFFPNSYLLADPGSIVVGDHNQFGEGGCFVKANRPDARIEAGDAGRYVAGCWLLGESVLGSGSQVIGQIYVENCKLDSGMSHAHDDPSERGGVLKGSGQARGLHVQQGFVVTSDNGRFHQCDARPQAHYHPRHNNDR